MYFEAHTPDNSFMGFAVPKIKTSDLTKEDIGVLYGKDLTYFQVGMVACYSDLVSQSIEGTPKLSTSNDLST